MTVTVKRAMLITPVHPERAEKAVATAAEAARAAGVQLVSTADEQEKHGGGRGAHREGGRR